MPFSFRSERFALPPVEVPSQRTAPPRVLEGVLRERYPEASRGAIRRLVESGKVFVDGERQANGRTQLSGCREVELRMTAPRPRGSTEDPRIAFADPHIVVVRKPAGISSVHHESEPTSLQQEVRRWLREQEGRPIPPLRVVHRLDKVTSGIMLFARSNAAQLDLKDQFRRHTTERRYTAVVHGHPREGTLRFRIVRDRGDGLRGVTKDPGRGTHSVTHVSVVEQLSDCSVIQCRLETGRTHQIRIHLARVGHPIVGEPLYNRDFSGTLLPCERTLLHAETLGFRHPVHRKSMSFQQELPQAFRTFLDTRRSPSEESRTSLQWRRRQR